MTEQVLVIFQMLFAGIFGVGTVAGVVFAFVFGVFALTQNLSWGQRLWDAALWFFGLMLVAVACAYVSVFFFNTLPHP